MVISLATTPQSNSKLLVRGWKLYVASFKHVYGLALLMSLLLFIPEFIAFSRGLNFLHLTQSLSFYNLFFFFIEFSAIFVFTALLWRMRCVVTNEHESILDDFKIASQKILLIMGASIFYLIFLSLVIFLFILLPAKNFLQFQNSISLNIAMLFLTCYFTISIYVFYLLFFSLPLILTENKGIFLALFKSASLVWGNWWRVFGLLIIPPLVYFLLFSAIQGLLKINLTIDVFSSFNIKHFFIFLFNVCYLALFIPFQGALLLLQLRDLEIRKKVSA